MCALEKMDPQTLIRLFNQQQYLYLPGPLPGDGDKVINKTDLLCVLLGLACYLGESGISHIVIKIESCIYSNERLISEKNRACKLHSV